MESEQATPVDSIKDIVRSSVKVPEFDKVRRTYRPKRCGNNNKDEDNNMKVLNDKNQQASTRKFRQHIYIYIYIYMCVCVCVCVCVCARVCLCINRERERERER